MKKQAKKLKNPVVVNGGEKEIKANVKAKAKAKEKAKAKTNKKDLEQIAGELRKWLADNYALTFGEAGLVIYHLQDNLEIERIIHFAKRYALDKK